MIDMIYSTVLASLSEVRVGVDGGGCRRVAAVATVASVAHRNPTPGEERPVKYADGPSVQVEVLVRAPVARVWELVTDIGLPARFSAEFVGASWLDDGPGPAARFVGRNHHDAFGEWETTSTVSRFEPMRAFGWTVSDPEHPSASWWFELDDGPDGVLLRQGTRMGPGRSGLNVAIDRMPDKEERIVARRLREHEANMLATVQGIKRIAEAGA
jgi:hypothetical protein